MHEGVGPAFDKIPVDEFGELVAHEIWVGGESGGVGFVLHDLHFGAVNFDFARVCAGGWIGWVSRADVGDFKDHVGGLISGKAVPERDADVLHTVAG